MANKKGSLSITSENIFPVIKKWLYSDHDIFLRELVSNGCDAITKLKKLNVMGDFNLPEGYHPEVLVDCNPTEKTLTITDNGIGMTAEEVDKYINQIAFSGATDFLEKYKDKADSEQIIGHFGLGFYSAFMVADTVDIDTLSYKEGSSAVHWTCDGGTDYEMTDGSRSSFGTTITLHINEDVLEFCNEYRIREIIEKYCSFMPYEIFLNKEDTQKKIDEENKKAEEDAKKDNKEFTPKTISPLNDINPLWNRTPSECTDDDYKNFYRKVFRDYKEPLFWIHLNMDYPFRLKGILYFPKISNQYESLEGTIKLYNNQVFIADNIKEVIPEFLMLLKGVIDCPDLPLNVSRSALQNDGFVTKISDYITKKVADKLTGMCKTDHENYEKYWDDISPFVKYGCLRDNKFCDKMNDYILFKDINDKYITLPDLLVKDEEDDKEKSDSEVVEDNNSDDSSEEKDTRTPVYYVTNSIQQASYISLFKEENMNAVILDQVIDTQFISQLESRNPNYKFMRIDSDTMDSLTEETNEEELKKVNESLSNIFKSALGNDKLKVKAEKFKNKDVSAMLNVSEEGRRINDMMKMYGMGTENMGLENESTLVLNTNNELVSYLIDNTDSEYKDEFAKQLYDLAVLQNHPLSADEMSEFVNRSNRIMMHLIK
ncbi:MAG: molecular chaperone HtpG [Lachnospiraceae bacterium]|nr:molecular chaperone HtpG [Lachnospiraceae bacterium]